MGLEELVLRVEGMLVRLLAVLQVVSVAGLARVQGSVEVQERVACSMSQECFVVVLCCWRVMVLFYRRLHLLRLMRFVLVSRHLLFVWYSRCFLKSQLRSMLHCTFLERLC